VNVVDSSGWLEYYAAGLNADHFSAPIRDLERLIVPSISIFEVFKRVRIQRGEASAQRAIRPMHRGRVVALDADLAERSALLSRTYRLPMADSIILATTQAFDATLWTQDADFDGLPRVRYFATL
jgi:predicted nucleic acid-binding protein